jgi:hypothetical protein
LEHRLGESVAQRFPDVQWVLRPNSWILVDRAFRTSPDFSLWYFSDNERIHIDMLSFGRFAHSNILGQIVYENLADAERYDPRQASYHAFRKTPAVDAALDLVTDLVGDRRSDLAPIRARHGADGLHPLEPVLARLEADGRVVRQGDDCEAVGTDGVFIDPFWPLLEAAMQDLAQGWTMPLGKQIENAIPIGTGDRCLLVFVEKARPEERYFKQMGQLGIYYRFPTHEQPGDQVPWVEELMRGFLDDLQRLVDRAPDISPRAAIGQLRRARSAS